MLFTGSAVESSRVVDGTETKLQSRSRSAYWAKESTSPREKAKVFCGRRKAYQVLSKSGLDLKRSEKLERRLSFRGILFDHRDTEIFRCFSVIDLSRERPENVGGDWL